MNILLLGGGGREHAFAWKLSQSPECKQLFIAPGNAGTKSCGTNIALNPNDFETIGKFCLENAVAMVVVGPEEPLVRGVKDYFDKNETLSNIMVIGPSARGAQLEGSKAFAKEFMYQYDIPTAAYKEFSPATIDAGLEYIAQQTPPIVLKADGLAAGKGVLICEDIPTAQKEFKEMLGGKFGDAGNKVVIEEFLDGIEFSVFVATDGKDYKILPVAKDYKRIGEGDKGLNTGGMGAVSPPPFVDDSLMQKVEKRIIQPTIKGIAEQNLDYKGFIFLGLIRVNGDPFVIEYNCRMGDPETEVVFPRFASDLVAMCKAIGEEKLGGYNLETDPRTAATVFLVSGGYPEAYEKGKEITGLEDVEGSLIFHAGTKENEKGAVVTSGGRVLAITSYGANHQEAVQKSLKNVQKVNFEKKNYRRDIGFDL